MSTSIGERITDYSPFFLGASNPTHRQYEALRAYFVEHLPSHQVAQRFGYTPGSFRVLCHQFRQDPHRKFFLSPQKGPQSAPKKNRLRDEIIAMRKQNLSIYDIHDALQRSGHALSPAAISVILKRRASLGFLGAEMTNAQTPHARTLPPSPMYAPSTSAQGRSVPSSLASFSSLPTSPPSPWTRCCKRLGFRARL